MDDVKEELTSLFEYRTRVDSEASQKIFGKMSHVIEGIDFFLTRNDPSYVGGEISWEDVQFIEENELVVLFGVLSFIPGSTINVAGSTIEVTEDNAPSFSRMIRIGLPLNLVSLNSQEEIIKFLNGVKTEQETLTKSNVKDLHSIAPFPMKGADDFNWDALTDDQKKSLIMSNVSNQKPS